MNLDTLKCFLVLNTVQREHSIVWGVDCGTDVDANILLALQFIAAIELEDTDDCPLENPLLCEINEYVALINSDSVYQCYVDDICESNVSLTCSLTINDPSGGSDCNTLGILEILN